MTRGSECLVTELTCKWFGTCMHPGGKQSHTEIFTQIQFEETQLQRFLLKCFIYMKVKLVPLKTFTVGRQFSVSVALL
jgi:hypothetical protein